jgi:hypothetical protein
MNKSYSIYLFLIAIFILSCDNNKLKKDETILLKQDSLKTVVVDKQLHDSLYFLCDSLASNIQKSMSELNKLDRISKRKDFNATDDFYMDYELYTQNVYGSAEKMNKMDSLCEASGIFIFNNKLFDSTDQALSTIDSIEKINPKMDDFHKTSLKKEKDRLIRMKGVRFVYKN